MRRPRLWRVDPASIKLSGRTERVTMLPPRPLLLLALTLLGCSAGDGGAAAQPQGRPFQVETLASFDEPWAMTFLPSGQALITEKRGRLKLWTPGGTSIDVSGVPRVEYGEQG